MKQQKKAAIAVSKVSITVANLEKSIAFYTEVLPFELKEKMTWQGENINALFGLSDESLKIEVAQLILGNEIIELIEFDTKKGRAIPKDSKSNDLWFQHIAIVVSDIEKAFNQIKDKVTSVSPTPQTLPEYLGAAAGISAYYFKDIDGHNLELIHFPKEKLADKFKKRTGLFLGIDHTAITVQNTAESALFYKKILELKVAGGSQNFGKEQENLTQVSDVKMDITTFVATEGLGIEFLEYIHPKTGRTYPEDSQVTDLWHWHTSVKVSDISSVYEQCQQHQLPIISKGIINLTGSPITGDKGFVVRDKNGHALFFFAEMSTN